MPFIRIAVIAVLSCAWALPALAQSPVGYRLTFPEAEHRTMHVEVTFPEIGDADLELHMSRSSPGRYALHEFAKNVYDVVIVGDGDRSVSITRPSLHEWRVAGHGGTVRVRYRVYGDQLDGTYLAVDSTHAHINMPAALMWARGFEDRPSRVAIEPPPGSDWRVATQLFAGEDGLTFTAPNLQYLMDSPIEVSRHTVRDFSVTRGTVRTDFRLALHGGSDDDATDLASDLEKIAREEGAIFGEFPRYDVGRYTFLTDCLPWADGDAMEHRNSTIITVPGSPADSGARSAILSNAAHELFHSWSVERIRPRSLEPFNLADANMSPELWLAEGVTSYYELLVMHRARLQSLSQTLSDFAALINQVTNSPARRIRSAQEMSRLAPFVDAAVAVDRTNWGNTFISYYTWGAAIGLGLDLALRDRTVGRVTLDDLQRDLWTTFGKPGGRQPGFVDRPYTSEDVTARLAAVSGDAAFAEEFITRYVAGHEVPDYERLLSRAGLALVARSPRTAWIGDLNLDVSADGARVGAPTPIGSPAYQAGLDQDDVIVTLDGEALTDRSRLDGVLRRRAPGEIVPITYRRRGGQRVTASVTLEADPRREIVTVESTGRSLTAPQKTFREEWLGSKGGS